MPKFVKYHTLVNILFHSSSFCVFAFAFVSLAFSTFCASLQLMEESSSAHNFLPKKGQHCKMQWVKCREKEIDKKCSIRKMRWKLLLFSHSHCKLKPLGKMKHRLQQFHRKIYKSSERVREREKETGDLSSMKIVYSCSMATSHCITDLVIQDESQLHFVDGGTVSLGFNIQYGTRENTFSLNFCFSSDHCRPNFYSSIEMQCEYCACERKTSWPK